MSTAVGDPAAPEVMEPPAPFSGAEIARRRGLVEDCAGQRGVDALVVYEANRSGTAVPWLTGWPVTREAALVIRPAVPPVLLVAFANHVPNASRVARDCEVRPCGPDTAQTLADLLGPVRRVGLVGAPPGPVRRVLDAAGDGVRTVEMDGDYQRLRRVKSGEELAHLRYAAWLTDRSAAALVAAAMPGATELDLVAAVEASYAGTGASNHVHYVAVTSMAAPDRCVPAQWPTDRAVARGSVVVFELSTAWGPEYPGQLLRTLTVEAEPTPLYRRLSAVATGVHDEIVQALRPGARPGDLLQCTRRVADAGFVMVDDVLHGFGGGYLPPVLSQRGEPTGPHAEPLVEGMTVVVQPNAATADGSAGVQTGELYEVTAEGARSLHAFPAGLLRGGSLL